MHKYSVVIRIILLWKYLKLKIFFVYDYWFYVLCFYLYQYQNKNKPSKSVHRSYKIFLKAYNILCKSKKALRYNGYCYNLRLNIDTGESAITSTLYRLVSNLWICERAGINVEFFTKNDEFQTLFDIPKQSSLSGEIVRTFCVRSMGKYTAPSKIAYKLSEKLPVRKELRKKADEWFNEHIRGDWVAVHYRGTDAVGTHRHKIKLEQYITYLKAVLDNKSSIFVCSDQAQFIDKMQVAFPGRVFARDIQRSSDRKALHRNPEYKGIQQQQDALIDILILAKAALIYTTGSAFVDVVRYFNPKTKIVALGAPKREQCYIPIPQKDVFDRLKKNKFV